MVKVIETIYEKRDFKSLEKVELKDGERVRIEIRKTIFGIPGDWMVGTQKIKDELRFSSADII